MYEDKTTLVEKKNFTSLTRKRWGEGVDAKEGRTKRTGFQELALEGGGLEKGESLSIFMAMAGKAHLDLCVFVASVHDRVRVHTLVAIVCFFYSSVGVET